VISLVRNLYQHRDLLWALTVKDTQIKYKQSLLGIAWAVFQPLSMMLVFSLVFTYLLPVRVETEIPYPIFLYSALVPWTYFSTGLSFAIPSLVSNLELVTKTAFPRETLPIAAILASAVDFAIAWCVLLVLLVFYGAPFTLWLLLAPFLALVQTIFMIGFGLLAAALNVFYRDVKYTIVLGLFLWMFVTPVIFSMDHVPEALRPWLLLNPMAGLVDSFRRVSALGVGPDPVALGSAVVIALLSCAIGQRVFKKHEKRFGDII